MIINDILLIFKLSMDISYNITTDGIKTKISNFLVTEKKKKSQILLKVYQVKESEYKKIVHFSVF